MNVKRFLPILLSVSTSAIVLSGCSDFDNGFDAKEVAYKQSFENAFGQIDPNQDWDLYGQLLTGKTLTTRAFTSSNVNIETLSQTVELTDEMMTLYRDMLPEQSAAGQTYANTNLGKVTQNFTVSTKEITLYPVFWQTSGTDEIGIYYHCSSTTPDAVAVTQNGKTTYIVRKAITTNKTNLEQIDWTDRGWRQKNVADVLTDEDWEKMMHNNSNYKVSDGTQYNADGGSISTGTKIIYAGKKSWSWVNEGAETDYYYTFAQQSSSQEIKEAFVAVNSNYKISDGTAKFLTDKHGNKVTAGDVCIYQEGTPSYAAYTGTDCSSIIYLGAPSARSTGIKVTLPETTLIGMYIKQGSNYMYSEYALNKKIKMNGDTDDRDVSYVATYIPKDADGNDIVDEDGKVIRYLCFEDWFEDSNFDLNDCVFRVFGFEDEETGESKIVDHDAEEAILVCEDLGFNDFDFNDIVLKLNVSKTTTSKTVYNKTTGEIISNVTTSDAPFLTITPMAAGGTLESYVLYEDKEVGGAGNNEIHKLLDGAAPSIINAGTNMGKQGTPIVIALNGETSGTSATILSHLFANNKIKIKVQNNDNDATIIENDYQDASAPQMMLLPWNFQWPQENTPITTAYPDFNQWVSDYKANTWINTPDASKVTHRSVASVSTENNMPANPEPDDVPNTPLELTFEAQSSIGWGESHYYKISCSDDSYLVEGAVIEFTHESGAYSDVCLSGTTTTWAQVGKSDGNYKNGKITLTAAQASTIATNGGFYTIVWYGDITSITITKP